MCNLLQNIATKQVKKSCCEFYHPHSNLSCNKSVYCLFCTYLNSDWMKLHRGYTIHRRYVIGCKTSLSWARKKCNKFRFCCRKQNYFLLSTTTLHKLQQPGLSQTGLKVGSKMHNFAFQLVLQQCCKTSCTLTSFLQAPCTQIDSHQPHHCAGPRTHSANQI